VEKCKWKAVIFACLILGSTAAPLQSHELRTGQKPAPSEHDPPRDLRLLESLLHQETTRHLAMESSANVPRADPTDAVEVESYVSGSEAEILERSRRSTSSLVPCHLLEEEGSLVRVGYTSAIADLVRRTEGVRNTSESIKQYVS